MAEPAPGCALIVTSVDDEAAAAALARTLVEERLAACVQRSAMRSCYRWQGRTEDAAEWRLEIKTTAARVDAVIGRLRECHPYEVPEILVSAVAASEDYLAWVEAAVAG